MNGEVEEVKAMEPIWLAVQTKKDFIDPA